MAGRRTEPKYFNVWHWNGSGDRLKIRDSIGICYHSACSLIQTGNKVNKGSANVVIIAGFKELRIEGECAT